MELSNRTPSVWEADPRLSLQPDMPMTWLSCSFRSVHPVLGWTFRMSGGWRGSPALVTEVVPSGFKAPLPLNSQTQAINEMATDQWLTGHCCNIDSGRNGMVSKTGMDVNCSLERMNGQVIICARQFLQHFH